MSRGTGPVIEPFAYPETPWLRERDGWTEAELSARFAEIFQGGDNPGAQSEQANDGIAGDHPAVFPGRGVSRSAQMSPDGGEVLESIESEAGVAEERGYKAGFAEGRARGFSEASVQASTQASEDAARQVHSERDRLYAQARALTESFARTRDNYLHELEQESVRLALAIAARILRREAQTDSLLLTGAVRVALGQLADATTVRLHVPERDQELWREALGLVPGLKLRPEVVGNPRMELGDCRMETEIGSTDLGLFAQLKEVERGFFDRMGDSDDQRHSEPEQLGEVQTAHSRAGGR